MRADIAVVISDGVVSRHVTQKVRNLRFARTAFGGDTSLSCDVLLPKSTFTDLGPNCTITVYDHDASVIWSGNIDNPGDSDGPAGEALQLTAFGGAVRLTYVTEPLGFVVTELEGWERTRNSNRRANFQSGERPNGTPTFQHAPKSGGDVPSGWVAESGHLSFHEAGLRVGRLAANAAFGRLNTDWQARASVAPDPSTESTDTQFRDGSEGLGRFGMQAFVSGETPPAFFDNFVATSTVKTFPALRTYAIGLPSNPGDAASENWWVEFYSIALRQLLKDALGNWFVQAGIYTRDYVFAHEVINHLVGQGMVPGADGSKARIATTDFQIDSLSWLDGINAADALEELRLFEPDLFWTLYGDEFTAELWSNLTPRYVINNRLGGITFSGDDRGTLVNRVTVQWTNERGRERTRVVTDPTVDLDYNRDLEAIQLPDGAGSPANAQRAGEKALELANKQPISGKAVIRQPIRDQITGEMVPPHRILPGNLVTHQETGRVYRLTEVDYSDPDGSALLSLGTPVKTSAQWMARSERRMRRRARRR